MEKNNVFCHKESNTQMVIHWVTLEERVIGSVTKGGNMMASDDIFKELDKFSHSGDASFDLEAWGEDDKQPTGF